MKILYERPWPWLSCTIAPNGALHPTLYSMRRRTVACGQPLHGGAAYAGLGQATVSVQVMPASAAWVGRTLRENTGVPDVPLARQHG